nr:MAG TPA: hypothetical protein [Bacteriophage sp.]
MFRLYSLLLFTLLELIYTKQRKYLVVSIIFIIFAHKIKSHIIKYKKYGR